MRDKVSIRVTAGRGGDGLVSFRREKYVPRGGPDGGDGGRGGNVIIAADEKEATLEAIRNKGEYKAESASHGIRSRKTGRQGGDIVIRVPVGTAIFDEDTDELIGELLEPGGRMIAAAGGAGGRGNIHFSTPLNRVPQEWEPGGEGESKNLKLIYSIPADAAVIGLPGSGKSSLIRALTRSRTEIGDYPFTTRSPHIGVCGIGLAGSFKILDMPALIEGSHEGRGIGNWFLHHLLRTVIIIYVLDATRPDGMDEKSQLGILRREVAAFDPAYAKKKELIVINKIDLAEAGERKKGTAGVGRKAIRLSAAAKSGINELIATIAGELGLELL